MKHNEICHIHSLECQTSRIIQWLRCGTVYALLRRMFGDFPEIKHYRKTSSINLTKSQNLNVSCIILQLSSLNPLKPCEVETEDVVGAAPTGDAPTTSELSTILLPTKVRLILEVLRYIDFMSENYAMSHNRCPTKWFSDIDTMSYSAYTFWGWVILSHDVLWDLGPDSI